MKVTKEIYDYYQNQYSQRENSYFFLLSEAYQMLFSYSLIYLHFIISFENKSSEFDLDLELGGEKSSRKYLTVNNSIKNRNNQEK